METAPEPLSAAAATELVNILEPLRVLVANHWGEGPGVRPAALDPRGYDERLLLAAHPFAPLEERALLALTERCRHAPYEERDFLFGRLLALDPVRLAHFLGQETAAMLEAEEVDALQHTRLLGNLIRVAALALELVDPLSRMLAHPSVRVQELVSAFLLEEHPLACARACLPQMRQLGSFAGPRAASILNLYISSVARLDEAQLAALHEELDADEERPEALLIHGLRRPERALREASLAFRRGRDLPGACRMLCAVLEEVDLHRVALLGALLHDAPLRPADEAAAVGCLIGSFRHADEETRLHIVSDVAATGDAEAWHRLRAVAEAVGLQPSVALLFERLPGGER